MLFIATILGLDIVFMNLAMWRGNCELCFTIKSMYILQWSHQNQSCVLILGMNVSLDFCFPSLQLCWRAPSLQYYKNHEQYYSNNFSPVSKSWTHPEEVLSGRRTFDRSTKSEECMVFYSTFPQMFTCFLIVKPSKKKQFILKL